MGLYRFLSLRGLYLKENSIEFFITSPFEGFSSLGWFFKNFNNSKFLVQVDNANINIQKLRLKLAVKNFNNLSALKLIEYLNILISNWSNSYSLTDFFFDISNELDVYLNKLLWKWARRRHPRRTNVWIYAKYWKYFMGKWKFFAFDISTSETNFLRSHFMNIKNTFVLPYSFSSFDYLESRKIEKFFYLKYSQNTSGVFRSLWIKQKGMCFVCRKPFIFLNSSNLKIYSFKFKTKFFKYLILAHTYCF